MSDYGDQWRESRQSHRDLVVGYCVCGRKLLRTWMSCICGERNPGYRAKEKKL